MCTEKSQCTKDTRSLAKWFYIKEAKGMLGRKAFEQGTEEERWRQCL